VKLNTINKLNDHFSHKISHHLPLYGNELSKYGLFFLERARERGLW
jgi:hypothetical protein